jgi:RNA polymerase sigma factor (sigma-70 family)
MSQTSSMSLPSVDPPPRLPPAQAEAHVPEGFLIWVADLVHAHRARLLGYVRRRGLAPDDALDVVQDSFASFLTLPEAPSIARVGDDAIRLLTVIARHNIMNRRRKRSRREASLSGMDAVLPDGSESSEELVMRAEQLARVRGCLSLMNRLPRAVILMSALDERPHQEVAELLGISPGHVRVLLHRARMHVRACPIDQMPLVAANQLGDPLAGP